VVEDPLFRTETMARLLAAQGKLRQAAEIYRHLLSEGGQRAAIRDALAEVERRLAAGRSPRQQATADLFARWTELTLRLQNARRLADCLKMLQQQQRRRTP